MTCFVVNVHVQIKRNILNRYPQVSSVYTHVLIACLMANVHEQSKQVNILNRYPEGKLSGYWVDRYGISVSQMTTNIFHLS